jgi:hypothetical protein
MGAFSPDNVLEAEEIPGPITHFLPVLAYKLNDPPFHCIDGCGHGAARKDAGAGGQGDVLALQLRSQQVDRMESGRGTDQLRRPRQQRTSSLFTPGGPVPKCCWMQGCGTQRSTCPQSLNSRLQPDQPAAKGCLRNLLSASKTFCFPIAPRRGWMRVGVLIGALRGLWAVR